MTTFSQAKNDIANQLGESYLDSQIGSFINRSIRYYQRNHYWFNEAQEVVVLEPDNAVVPSIPDDFQYEIKPGGLTVLDSNSYYVLNKISNAEYDALNTQGQGLPFCYRNRAGTLEVYFYPDKAYNLRLYYVKKYDELVADGDTNDFLTHAQDLIINKTLANLYEAFRKDNQQASYFRAVADDEELNLRQESMNRIRTGCLDIDTLTDPYNYYFNYGY